MSDEAPSLALQLGSTALALVFVLVLAWLALRLLKRFHERGASVSGGPTLEVLRSVSLGPRERLVLVRWRDQELLLGVTAGGITRIDSAAAAPSSGQP